MNRTNYNEKFGIVLMFICACELCIGQFVWKRWTGFFSLLIGFAIYGAGAVTMLCAFRFGRLSVLQPINSVSYVASTLLGSIFFDEPITLGKVAGIMMIMIGVFLLTREDPP